LWNVSLVSSAFTRQTLIVSAILFLFTTYFFVKALLLIDIALLLAIVVIDWNHYISRSISILKLFTIPWYFDFSSEKLELKNRQEQTLKAKFYKANSTNAPVVFQIHGGGYSRGSIEQINCYNEELRKQGFHVAVLSYRFIPEVNILQIINDLEDGFHFFEEYLKNQNIPLQEIIISGRSAGGHLAMALTDRLQDSRIKKIISFYPLTDFRAIQKDMHEGDLLNWPERFPQIFKNLDESFIEKMGAQNFSFNGASLLLIHGDRDPVVDVSQSDSLARALEDRKISHRYLRLKNQSHAFDVNINSLVSQYCLSQIIAFIKAP
jgi:acetyl esterase/lipase